MAKIVYNVNAGSLETDENGDTYVTLKYSDEFNNLEAAFAAYSSGKSYNFCHLFARVYSPETGVELCLRLAG